MAVYSISYDLHKRKDYDRIWEGIDKVSRQVWVKILESHYFIRTDLTSGQIRDFLIRYIDNDDSLFVIKVDIDDWSSKTIDPKLTKILYHWSEL